MKCEKKYDILIVGSGLFGATFAYRARKAGKKCLVIDKRPQLGGNVYSTIISREYSTEYKPGMEPYYTVNDDRNNALADQYRSLAAQEQNVIFGGRLAEYKYYDMAPIVEKVLNM